MRGPRPVRRLRAKSLVKAPSFTEVQPLADGLVADMPRLTHLSLSVSDLSDVLATVEGFGGSVVEGTGF
jgi:hypothetical protein